MAGKRGPERLTSSSRIAGSLENTPENRAILKNEPIKTSIGHWKAKLIESGFFGEIKDGDDPKTFYAGISRKADDFLKQLFQRARGMPEKWGMVNEDGSLNLDFEIGGELLGQFDFEMTRMFAREMVNEAIEKYGLKTIGARVREARKDKTFRELRRTVLDVVPKEVLDMEVYDKDKLGLSLINEIMPARLFDVTYGSAEMFSGEDELGNQLLESEVPDEKLSEIDAGLTDLLNSNYQYERMAGEKSRQLLGLVIPMDERKRKVLDSVGIKQRE